MSESAELVSLVDVEPASAQLSPYATAQPVRVSADVLDAGDPAAALATRFLLRDVPNTRAAYETDPAEWFGFCARLRISPLQAKLDHADAFRTYLAEIPGPNGRRWRLRRWPQALGRLQLLPLRRHESGAQRPRRSSSSSGTRHARA